MSHPAVIEMNPLEIHSLFHSLTGLAPVINLTNDYAIQSAWIYWLKAYTADDLRLVVRYCVSRIKRDNWKPAVMTWRNIIADPVRFGELLAEAHDWSRNRVKPGPPTFTPVVAQVAPQTNHSRKVSSIVKALTDETTFSAGMAALRKAAK